MNSIASVVSIAKKYIGYMEKATNAQLDSYTANAGKSNYTRFARDYAAATGINIQGQSWCDCFIDWCFIEAYGVESARKLLCGFSAYTPTSAQNFVKQKQWVTVPKVGDIIFFKNDYRICHTGIVYAVTETKVFTVEGNTSGSYGVVANGGCVAAKLYSLSNKRIAGYGRPAYESEVNIMSDAERKEVDSLKAKVAKLEAEKERIYHYVIELPDYAKPVIQKLLNKGIYHGASDADLNLPESMMRVFVINDRAGLYN